MRPASGGVAVVVRDWESQSHGEGRQEVSFWTTEALRKSGGFSMNVEVVQRRLWEQSKQHRSLRESTTPLFPVDPYEGEFAGLWT